MKFYKKRIAKFLYLITMALLGLSGYLRIASAEFVKVVDGDSLEIGARRVRLLEIDAPEFKQYCFTATGQKYDCGIESLKYLKKMLKDANFKVDCQSQRMDRYKRELAVCYAGEKNLNLEMLKAGWAVTYLTDQEDFLNAEKEAKKHKRGIWQGKFMRPEYYRRLNRR